MPSTRRRSRGEDPVGSDNVSPETRRLRANQETVRGLLGSDMPAVLNTTPVMNTTPVTTNEINIISRVVRLTIVGR